MNKEELNQEKPETCFNCNKLITNNKYVFEPETGRYYGKECCSGHENKLKVERYSFLKENKQTEEQDEQIKTGALAVYMDLYSDDMGHFQTLVTTETKLDYCKNCVPNELGIDIDNYRVIGEMYNNEKAKNVAQRHPCFLRVRYRGGKTESMPQHERDIRLCLDCSIKTVKGFLKYGDAWKLDQNEKEKVVDNLLKKLEKEANKRKDKEPEKIREQFPIHNSSDLLDQMTEEDIDNLEHTSSGQSGHGDGLSGYCMWCGSEFSNLAVSHRVTRFNKNVGSCYKCFIENTNREHKTLPEQLKFMWNNWHKFKQEEMKDKEKCDDCKKLVPKSEINREWKKDTSLCKSCVERRKDVREANQDEERNKEIAEWDAMTGLNEKTFHLISDNRILKELEARIKQGKIYLEYSQVGCYNCDAEGATGLTIKGFHVDFEELATYQREKRDKKFQEEQLRKTYEEAKKNYEKFQSENSKVKEDEREEEDD